jgi:type IV pilus assembly protein PilO
MLTDWLTRYSKIPERIRYPVGACLLALLVGSYILLVHVDQQLRLTGLEENFRQMETTRSEKRAYADNLPKYQARYTEMQQLLSSAKTLLPDTSDVPQFLAQLNTSAREVGLNIDRFEPLDQVMHDFYAEIASKMLVHGSYHEMAMFIDQVAKVDRIVNISEISMTQPRLENDKVLVSGAFLIKTYRFLGDAALAELEAKKAKAHK